MDIDYEAIGNGIKAVLDAALLPQYLSGIKVEVDPPEVGLSNTPEVGIYVAEEDPTETEVGSDSPYDTVLRFELLCGVTGPDFKSSRRAVYLLVNRVKAALQAERSLGGTVETSSRGAIVFETVEQGGFWSAAKLTLNARMMA